MKLRHTLLICTFSLFTATLASEQYLWAGGSQSSLQKESGGFLNHFNLSSSSSAANNIYQEQIKKTLSHVNDLLKLISDADSVSENFHPEAPIVYSYRYNSQPTTPDQVSLLLPLGTQADVFTLKHSFLFLAPLSRDLQVLSPHDFTPSVIGKTQRILLFEAEVHSVFRMTVSESGDQVKFETAAYVTDYRDELIQAEMISTRPHTSPESRYVQAIDYGASTHRSWIFKIENEKAQTLVKTYLRNHVSAVVFNALPKSNNEYAETQKQLEIVAQNFHVLKNAAILLQHISAKCDYSAGESRGYREEPLLLDTSNEKNFAQSVLNYGKQRIQIDLSDNNTKKEWEEPIVIRMSDYSQVQPAPQVSGITTFGSSFETVRL